MDNQSFDNIDKTLVTENNLYFSRGNDIQRFSLTEDGVVEKYLNESLQQTFPFSKLGLTRECKTLASEGYTLTWNNIGTDNLTEATISSTNNENDINIDMSNPEQAKQDLQQNIKDVEELQNLKDELNDKVADLMEEAIEVTEPFPSNDFSSEPVLYQDLDVETFNEELTAEQKAYINTYLGTIEEFVDAMLLLYNEVGDGISPMISIDDYVKELLAYDGGITEWSQELADMLGFDLKYENKEKLEEIPNNDLEKLANDIVDWYGADMGTYFDEIRGNEEEIYHETLGYLENKDIDMINHFITDITLGTDTDDEEFKSSSEDLVNRLKQLLNTTEVKTENKSKFYTADKMFDDFLKTAKEEAEEDGYTFKLSDLGLTREDSADFKNLLLQRDEIEDVLYDPQNNTYTVKVTGVETEEKPVEKEDEKKTEKVEENKIEETNNLSRLYQHTKDKDTFAIIGSQDQDTKKDRSNELKSEIGKAQKQFSNVGYNRLEGTYTYENGEQGIENSYIIYNIPKGTALDIADKLNQESIIWKDDNYFGFLKTDGSEDGQFKNAERNMTFDEKITDMFGSRFKNGSNRLAFAFECKLIETTDTGSTFSKQNKQSIVEFPICKIEVPKSKNI